MKYITPVDFVLLPIFLALFFLIIKKRAKYLDTIELKKYFFIAFFLRMLGSVAYSLMVQYYYGYGDSFTYFYGSNFIIDEILKDINNLDLFFIPAEEVFNHYNREVGNINWAGYFELPSSLAIMRISALLSIVSFNKFLIISLFFGFFSFWGQWKLFLVFNDILEGKQQKILAYGVLFTPSIWFWGSGLMKDSITLGCTGFIVSILYFAQKNKTLKLKSLLLLILLLYLVYIIKSYIFFILLAGFMFMFFLKLFKVIKNIVLKAGVVILFLFSIILIFFVFDINSQLQSLMEGAEEQILGYSNNYSNVNSSDENSKAGIEMGKIDFSISGLILHTPVAIFNCLFRPFLWESKKIIILLTSLESTVLLLITLRLLLISRLFNFFKIVFAKDYVLFSFICSICFALIIGFTTFNFGTMIRYKIILLPFYYFVLIFVDYKIKENQPLSLPV